MSEEHTKLSGQGGMQRMRTYGRSIYWGAVNSSPATTLDQNRFLDGHDRCRLLCLKNCISIGCR